MKKLIILCMIISLAVITACMPAKTGYLTLEITDAPSELDINEALMTISKVQVHAAGTDTDDDNSTDNETNDTMKSGWITVMDGEKTFDLIQIMDSSEYMGDTELAIGKYTQIRLTLKNALVTINGTQHDMKVPSNKLKLIKPFEIREGQNLTLTLDFDAQKSIHETGNGKFILKPTIKIIEN